MNQSVEMLPPRHTINRLVHLGATFDSRRRRGTDMLAHTHCRRTAAKSHGLHSSPLAVTAYRPDRERPKLGFTMRPVGCGVTGCLA